jgi:hypothetical protein
VVTKWILKKSLLQALFLSCSVAAGKDPFAFIYIPQIILSAKIL